MQTSQLIRQRNRHTDVFDQYNQVQEHLADQLLERLDLVTIEPATILEIGSFQGSLTRSLQQRYRKTRILGLEPASRMCRQASKQRGWFDHRHFFSADPCRLPLPDHSVDLVVSNLFPIWVDSLLVLFSEASRVLKPNGLLLYSSLGPDSLKEVDEAWNRVDPDYPHRLDFTDMHDIGDAMTRGGFHGIVMENEPLYIQYDSIDDLHRDLRYSTSANLNPLRRRTLTGIRRFRAYQEQAKQIMSTGNGDLQLTLDTVFGHGWAGYQKPRKSINDPFTDLDSINIRQLS